MPPSRSTLFAAVRNTRSRSNATFNRPSPSAVCGVFQRCLGRVPTPEEQQATSWQAVFTHVAQAPPPPRRGTAGTAVVLMLFHNNATYVQHTLPRLMRATRNAANRCGLATIWYFYENDSTDGTPERLRALRSRSVHVCTEQTQAAAHGVELSRTEERATRMSRLRNALLGMALADVAVADAVLCIDTNVWFRECDVAQLLACVLARPDVGLVGACTMDVRNVSHYYDTYAYESLDEMPGQSVDRITCPWSRCDQCRWRRGQAAPLAPGPLHFVASCFGGLAAVQPAALLRARWSSVQRACEHVALCAAMRQAGFAVAVLPAARALWSATFPRTRQLLISLHALAVEKKI